MAKADSESIMTRWEQKYSKPKENKDPVAKVTASKEVERTRVAEGSGAWDIGSPEAKAGQVLEKRAEKENRGYRENTLAEGRKEEFEETWDEESDEEPARRPVKKPVQVKRPVEVKKPVVVPAKAPEREPAKEPARGEFEENWDSD